MALVKSSLTLSLISLKLNQLVSYPNYISKVERAMLKKIRDLLLGKKVGNKWWETRSVKAVGMDDRNFCISLHILISAMMAKYI